VDEARWNLKASVRLFVDEAEKLGTLQNMLSELGIKAALSCKDA
jgi:hypothetical protein